jgi:hypothetical protein
MSACLASSSALVAVSVPPSLSCELRLINRSDDPWKESTVASDYYNYPNTTDHPVGLGNGEPVPNALA